MAAVLSVGLTLEEGAKIDGVVKRCRRVEWREREKKRLREEKEKRERELANIEGFRRGCKVVHGIVNNETRITPDRQTDHLCFHGTSTKTCKNAGTYLCLCAIWKRGGVVFL